jgi:hypothetical protein
VTTPKRVVEHRRATQQGRHSRSREVSEVVDFLQRIEREYKDEILTHSPESSPGRDGQIEQVSISYPVIFFFYGK